MPLSNKEELNLIVNPETKLNIEHSGGDGWTILHGDMLSIVKAFKPGVFDAVITDPPYASGGAKPSEKNRTTNQKYSSMKADKALPDFDGDQKDQRSWTRWCAEWLSDVRRACKPGAVLVVFIDWRMAPCLSDAIQWAGWIWRGQIVWDKQVSRPQRGRFRQQSEFALWASNGPLPMDRPVGCLPGVFRYTNPANRIHVTEKPLQLMRDVVQICVPGVRILDPFAGAGTTVYPSDEPKVHDPPATRQIPAGTVQDPGEKLHPGGHPPSNPVPVKANTGWQEKTAAQPVCRDRRTSREPLLRPSGAVCFISLSGWSAAP